MNKNYFTLRSGADTDLKERFGKVESPPSSNLYHLWLFVLLIALSFGQSSWAQSTANYSFSASTTGSLIDMSTGTTQILAPGVDDTVSALTNFNLSTGASFDFYFMGSRYTQFGVSDNGLMTLGTTPGTSTYAIPNSTVPTLAPFANDMRIGSNGKVEAKVIGTAPNRTLVVQWTNVMVRYLGSAAAGTGTFQVRLNEGSGIIEYAYGAMETNTSTPAVYYVGFSSNTTSTNLVTINTTTNTASTVTPALSNAYTASSTITALNSTADGSRVVYTFKPPGNAGNTVAATLAAPTALTFTGVGSSTTTLNWVAAAPTTGIQKYAVYRSADAGATYSFQSLVNLGTNTLAVTGLTPSTNYLWKVFSISEGGKSVELTSAQATNAPGTFTTIATGNWTSSSTWDAGSVPTLTDNAIVSATHTVTLDAAGLVINNLGVNGILNYGSTPTSFAINGNLTVNSGGILNVFNASTGKTLNVAGDILNNGTIDVSVGSGSAGTLTLNGTTVQTVSGSGVFNTEVIRNLVFNNTNTTTPNIIWQFNNIKIANNLDLTAARVNLGSNKITFGNNAAGNTLTAPAGTGFLSGGKFSRWWTATATGTSITAGTDPTNTTSRYPFVSSTGLNRSMWITRTNATGAVAGELAVVYTDASTSTTGLSVLDGTYTVTDRFDGNWAVSNEGTPVSASSYTVTIVAPSAYFAANGNSRIMFAGTALGGAHQNGTSTPGAQRITVPQADLLSAPLYIGVGSSDVPFVSVTNGNWSVPSTWNKNAVPTATDIVSISSATTVTLDGANLASTVNVNTGGTLIANTGSLTTTTTLINNGTLTINGSTVTATTTATNAGTMNVTSGTLNVTGASTTGLTNSSTGILTVNGGTINIASAGNNNRTFSNSGTLTVSSGAINVFGNMIHTSGSFLNQSGGDINIDGNNAGLVANSVASGTHLFDVTASAVANLNLTGGTITIVDPPQSASTSTYAVRVSQGGAYNSATTGHTFRFGDGVSTDNGTAASNGFYIYTFPGTYLYGFGNLVVNSGTGVSRFVKNQSTFPVKGNFTITSGEFVLNSTMHLNGNLVNNGTLTATSTLTMGDYTGSSQPSTNAQSISGSGLFRNLATAETAKMTSLTVNNSNATGVTLDLPMTLSGTLTLTNGKLNTTDTNLLTLAIATATTSGGSATSYVNGPLARTIATGNANTNYIFFPVGKATYAPISVAPTTTTVAVMKAETFDTNTGTMDPSIINLSSTRRWEAPIVSGTVTNLNVRLGATGIGTTSIPVQAPIAAGVYTNAFGSLATAATGTPNTTTSLTPADIASYTGFLSFADSNACSGTPAPGNTIASATVICSGTTVSFSLQNVTSGTGVTYVWESSVDGITYAPIASATASTYSVAPTAAGYYRAQVTCSGTTTASTAVQVTFSNSVTGTTSGTRCGQGTVNLEAVGSAGTTIKWYSTETGGNILSSGATYTTPVITTTSTYYAAAQSSSSGSASVGAGASSSSAASMPFNGGYGSLKGQYLFTAAELTAAGLTTGSIGSLALDFTTTGGNYLNFEMSIGNSALSVFPASGNIQGGLTTVYTAASFTPSIGVNTFAFGTGTGASSFIWDGTSNVIVSICWTYGATATSGTAATVKTDTFTGNVSQTYRKDNENSPCGFTGAIGAGTSTYSLSAIRPRITFGGQVACLSPRVPVIATVTTPPALTLSAAPVAFCSGDSSSLVTLTSTASDYDTYTWSPATGVDGTSALGWTFNPSETTTYTLTASQSTGSLCSTTTSIVISVNPLPSVITITPASAPVCVNGIQQLTAAGGNSVVTLLNENFNAPTNGWTTVNNTTGGTPANTAWTLRADNYTYGSYATWHSNDNSQFYLTNSDAGGSGSTTATLLQSPSFSTTGYASAELKFFSYLYDTSASSTTGKVQASLDGTTWTDLQTITASTVNTTTNFTAITVPLTAAFIDKPVVYIRFSYAGAYRYFWGIDNVSVSAVKQFDLTWAPVTNLYTDAAATVPYTAATNAPTVYFKSNAAATATTYTVTAENTTTSCERSATVAVTVNALPVLTIVNPAAVCSPATVDLTAATITTGSDTGLTFTYWTNDTATTAMATPTTAGAGTYYIKAVNANGCSVISPVVVTVNTLPTLVVTNPSAVCSPATIDLTAAAVTAGSDTGLTLTYWADPSATVTFPDPNAVTAGTYFIKATNASGCFVIASVTATVNALPSLVITNPAAVCSPSTVDLTAAAIVAGSDTGLTFTYWADPFAAVTFPDPNAIASSGTFYIKATTASGCFVIAPVVVTVNVVDAPTGTAVQDFTTGQTLADFVVVGDNITWYDAATNGNELPATTVLVSGTAYYASQTVGACESATRLMVTAGVDLKTPVFNSANLKYYPNPVSDILTVTYSETIEAIEIFNVLGQRVYQKTHNSQEVKIDMSSLASGNYIVNVVANGLVKNIKVIKK